MGKLDGQVALVSGGARGMGAAEARLFAAEGARVVIGDVLVAEGETLAKEIGDAAAFAELDVTDEGSWAAAVAGAAEGFGAPVTVLVNNAGILQVKPLAQLGADEFMRVVEVNQLGVFLGMKAVAPAMAEAGGGSIVNISSVAGLTGLVGHLAYTASKWAVRGMTKTAALELASAGIRVNSIHPGTIDTPMLDQYRELGMTDPRLRRSSALGRVGTPDDVARMALFLASDDSSYSTGSEFVVDGGIMAGLRPPE